MDVIWRVNLYLLIFYFDFFFLRIKNVVEVYFIYFVVCSLCLLRKQFRSLFPVHQFRQKWLCPTLQTLNFDERLAPIKHKTTRAPNFGQFFSRVIFPPPNETTLSGTELCLLRSTGQR